MKLRIIFFTSLLLFFFSCKKKDCDLPEEAQFNQAYYPLTPGSYWIYQWYRVDTLGNEWIMENTVDTIRVLKDTLIDGNIYAKIRDYNTVENSEPAIYFRRDSSGHLVDQRNNIFFSSGNFVDILHHVFSPGLFEINFKMDIPTHRISTPIGEYDCLNFQGEVIPIISTSWDKRYLNNFFSKGVGLVMETTFFFSSEYNMERRLTEYHIE